MRKDVIVAAIVAGSVGMLVGYWAAKPSGGGTIYPGSSVEVDYTNCEVQNGVLPDGRKYSGCKVGSDGKVIMRANDQGTSRVQGSNPAVPNGTNPGK